MREIKRPEEEMLIVHKPALKPDPAKLGRAQAEAPRSPALDRDELELMKRRLAVAKGSAARRAVVLQIQHKFGNDKAAQVLRELGPIDDDPGPKPKSPGQGGSKA